MLHVCQAELRAQGVNSEIWDLEWVYSDGSGAVANDIDRTQSCVDVRYVTQPVVSDGGAGITNIKFPKCSRVWVEHCSLLPVTVGTAANWRQCLIADIDADAGTATFRMLAANGGAYSDPENGSRARVSLRLEHK